MSQGIPSRCPLLIQIYIYYAKTIRYSKKRFENDFQRFPFSLPYERLSFFG